MPADAPAGRYLIAGGGGNERHRSLALVADLAEMRPHAVGNVAYFGAGQKCWMSAWHSVAIHAAFDSPDEQPTESSLICDWMHA